MALSGGIASFTTSSSLAVGTDTIKASYGGDSNFKASSGIVGQAVNLDATSTALAASANPSVYGQSVTFTATVTAGAPGGGAPTGSVTFMNGFERTLGTVATFRWHGLVYHGQPGDSEHDDHRDLQREQQFRHQ